MQMGARWVVGDAPHRSVPPVLLPAIALCEQETPGAESWTLTWLEGRPRLALDGQPRLTLDAVGAPALIASQPDELSAQESNPNDEDTDDDWLS